MSFKEKAIHELKQVGLVTLYFAVSFGLILFLKKLFLAEYDISIAGFSAAIIAALVVAKVVVILDNTPVGNRFEDGPLYLDTCYRSLVYTFFVGLVVYAEHAFEARHEAGGFKNAVVYVYGHRNMDHFWATIICIFLIFVGYNVVSAINRHLGKGELVRLFFSSHVGQKEWEVHQVSE